MLFAALTAAMLADAQTPVAVGHGSYASEPPAAKSRTSEHEGCYAGLMSTAKIYLDEKPGRPIPTNDWWTDLLYSRYAGALWSYPQMLHPHEGGVDVNYPSYWNENGTEVKARTKVTVGADGFSAGAAIAADWHDWDVEMRMPDKNDPARQMYVTMVHGTPFSWFEMQGGLVPQINFSSSAIEVVASGSGRLAVKVTVNVDGTDYTDCYGLFFRPGAQTEWFEDVLEITGTEFVVVSLLRDTADLETYAAYACNIPRSTDLRWSYDDANATMTTNWTVNAENLLDPSAPAPVLQGFIPHACKHAMVAPQFTDISYMVPRGTMKIARPTVDNSYSFTYRFNGLTPMSPAPDATADTSFSTERLRALMEQNARDGAFGDDTYWGGKGLIQMAMNMWMAKLSGEKEIFETSRDKLRAKLQNWLTYTPGEPRNYFAYYPRWGSLVGFEVSYDSDKFNDHHFHYGYFMYAGALLCMVDAEFCRDYGPMLRTLAKDYANWQKEDTRFPFLRTLDPWFGHSFAGGLGDAGNDNGNGQESSSEAMQGWGGMYLLAVALGDTEMRDAAILGWITESNAVAEYWFDRDHIEANGGQGNYDYTKYDKPWNTNITCKGIGWWTWFSGDPLWMHSIQWMPVSPCLNYLSQDLTFAKWDYEQMVSKSAYKWFEGTAQTPALCEQSVGNVVLCYLERFDPKQAAQIFDRAYDLNKPLARATDTGHISYWTIHSHLTHGDIDWSVYANDPCATAYRKADGTMTYSAFNAGDRQKQVTFYRDGVALRTIDVPAHGLVAVCAEPKASDVTASVVGGDYIAPGTSARVIAQILDQYGAAMSGIMPEVTLSTGAPATYSEGILTIDNSAVLGTEFTVTAAYGCLTRDFTVTVNEPCRAVTLTVMGLPAITEVGTALNAQVVVMDQYSNSIDADVTLTVTDGSGNVSRTEGGFVPASPGRYTVSAKEGSLTADTAVIVTPLLTNIALHKTAYSSSEENAGCLTVNLTDGDEGNRWGSEHSDDQWCYVDLGGEYTVTRVEPVWETAYGADYDIDLSNDGRNWTTAATIAGNNSAGRVSHIVNGNTRYVRIHGRKRGTSYGYSIHELCVYGLSADTDPDAPLGIAIDAPVYVNEFESVPLQAAEFCLNGTMTPITAVTWSADNTNASIIGNTLTAHKYGTVTVTASANGLSSSHTLTVNEVTRLDGLTASVSRDRIIAGESVQFIVEGNNQFGGLYPLDDLSVSMTRDNSGNGVSANPADNGLDTESLVFTPTGTGEYTVTFASGGKAASVSVSVRSVTEANLALGKPATASSVRDGNAASNVTDGDTDSRWESEWSDDHHVTVDLQKTYLVNRVHLIWEGAYASEYEILTSTDRRNWKQVYSTSDGIGGNEDLTFATEPARYVRLHCSKRATGYGNSVREMEVYGASVTTGVDEIHNFYTTDIGDHTVTDFYTVTGRLAARRTTLHDLRGRVTPGIYVTQFGKVLIK